MQAPIDEALNLIRSANHIAIATHIKPDGDALGSLLATGRIVQSLGKAFILLCQNPVPASLKFLPGSNTIQQSLGDFEPDLFIGVDANDAARLGKAGEKLVKAGLTSINIDHHVTNDNFGTVNLVDAEWASTTEGILMLADALGIVLDEEMAFCLLTGLVTDTRGFRTANVNPRTMIIAGRLMEAGADLPRIAALALDRTTLPELALTGVGLRNLKLEDCAAWTTLSLSENKDKAASSGLASTLLGIEGICVAAVFREKLSGKVELSMRAEPGFDVATLAVSIGGGGHSLAAGATIKATLDEAVDRVVPLLKEAASNGTANH